MPGSLAEIAAKIGTAKQVVHRWRRGEKVPGAGPRLRLRDTYGIAPAAWEQVPDREAVGPPPPPAPPPASRAKAAAASASPPRSGKPTLDEVIAELEYLHELRRDENLIASAKVRLSDSISKNLALKARLEREQELLDDRIVREHPMWLRIKDALRGALKPYPDAARAVAEALASVEA